MSEVAHGKENDIYEEDYEFQDGEQDTIYEDVTSSELLELDPSVPVTSIAEKSYQSISKPPKSIYQNLDPSLPKDEAPELPDRSRNVPLKRMKSPQCENIQSPAVYQNANKTIYHTQKSESEEKNKQQEQFEIVPISQDDLSYKTNKEKVSKKGKLWICICLICFLVLLIVIALVILAVFGWIYYEQMGKYTKCYGQKTACCTKNEPCSIGEGQCNSNDDCVEGLTCGTHNCIWDKGSRCCELERVNGSWSRWRSFGACTKTCGVGNQTRNRFCINPPPLNGGSSCYGKAEDTRNCSINPCQVNGEYGQWSSYGPCTKTCGSGTQSRTRSCDSPTPTHGGKGCTSLGSATETKSCNTQTCYLYNLALGKSATASTIYTSTPISRLTDGKMVEEFQTTCTGGVRPWVQIDLTTEKNVEKVYLYYLSITSTKHLLDAYVSVDGVICGTASNSRTVSSALKYYEVNCTTTLKGRYVKAELIKGNDACLFAVEIEVYGYWMNPSRNHLDISNPMN